MTSFDGPTETIPPPPVGGHGLLAGKTAVVTAAAGSGIGSSVAQRFIEEGARVLISDRHPTRLAETAERLDTPSLVCDVSDDHQIRALVDGAIAELGGIDIWVNNAGLGGQSTIVEMDDAQWHQVLDISLTSVFRCLRAVLPHMYERGRGAIVNNASVLGWRAQTEQAHYAAAKAGVMALTRSAAMESAPHGVRVNAVAPSLAMHANLAKASSDGLLESLTRLEAFGRAAQPWEVANVMVFLASDYSSYMTGEIVSVSSQRA